MKFSDLVGLTLETVRGLEAGSYTVHVVATDGRALVMEHEQNCCEYVAVEDVIGDVQDILGTPILFATEEESTTNPDDVTKDDQDSFTWTFYRLGTVKGTIVIRWYGTSNGCYSERVNFKEAS